jgi:hypothetical protein
MHRSQVGGFRVDPVAGVWRIASGISLRQRNLDLPLGRSLFLIPTPFFSHLDLRIWQVHDPCWGLYQRSFCWVGSEVLGVYRFWWASSLSRLCPVPMLVYFCSDAFDVSFTAVDVHRKWTKLSLEPGWFVEDELTPMTSELHSPHLLSSSLFLSLFSYWSVVIDPWLLFVDKAGIGT